MKSFTDFKASLNEAKTLSHSPALVMKILTDELGVKNASKDKRAPGSSNKYSDTATDNISWTKASPKLTPDNIKKAFLSKGYTLEGEDDESITFRLGQGYRQVVDIYYTKTKNRSYYRARIVIPKSSSPTTIPYYD